MLQTRALLTITLILFVSFGGWAQTIPLSESAEISVITCAPGNEAYSVYGHSAFRVKDPAYNRDMVFNYGIFDFSTPNFVYRFAAGQTDYLLGASSFDNFIEGYIYENRSVTEQVLNLTPQAKQQVFDFLVWNAQPENRVYRYNFFFDNCASRIRDVIEQQVDGAVVFANRVDEPKTFRSLIKMYHSKLPWMNFGVDLVVSAPADRIASLSEEMFLPDYVMSHFATATIVTPDGEQPLVKHSQTIFQAAPSNFKSTKFASPFCVFGLMFLITLAVSVRQLRKNKVSPLPDYLIFGFTGLMGTVMLWLAMFSEHPAMSPNYNLLWAIPANLLFAILWMVKSLRSKLQYYHPILSIWLIVFLIAESFLPQKLHPVHILFVLMMLSRSVLYSIFIFRRKTSA